MLAESKRENAVASPVKITRVDAWALRARIGQPVETSFGIMRDRPAVFVRVEDAGGAFGFGEIWCNFPGCGAEHRVRLATGEIGPLLVGSEFASPAEAFAVLTDKVRIRVLQSAEVGPYRQAIAGIDIALWDLAARKAGKPLAALLDDAPAADVPVYASGIHIGAAPEMTARARASGYRAFKVKVGFGLEKDVAGLRDVAAGLQPGERLFTDANQAWSLAQSLDFARAAKDLPLGWLEEPMPADACAADWGRLAAEGGIPLAAGENMAGDSEFRAAIHGGAFAYIQPDVAKWGGVSRCFPAARAILDGGRTYCPHFLGGGIGLAASAHLLAAAGGPGLLEVDANSNPLREAFEFAAPRDGSITLPQEAGLGIEEIPAGIRGCVTLHQSWPG
ncbi:MAG: mandelate racemase/muconate lactonizing enzyme family protein [Hyphomicrobiales bacterium]